MARTAPVPNIPAIPGMNPGVFIMGGGGAGGGGSGDAGQGNAASQGGSGENGGNGADGGGKNADSCGTGASGRCNNCGHNLRRGDPVDVATGRVFTLPAVDLAIRSPLPLSIRRSYNGTARHRDVGLGFGWSHNHAWELEVRRRTVHVWTGDGMLVELDRPAVDAVVVGPRGFLLRHDREGFSLYADNLWRLFPDSSARGDRRQLSELVDRNGNRIRLSYDEGRLARIIDSVGREVRALADTSGRIAAFLVKNAEHQGQWITLVRYRYDTRGDLIAVADPEGNETTYTYDDEHRLKSHTRPESLTFHFTYDSAGRCVETWGALPDGSVPGLIDDAPGYLADRETRAKGLLHCKLVYGDHGYREVIDSRTVQRLSVDDRGLVGKGVAGQGVVTRTFDAPGNLTSHTDALGATTQWKRDPTGQITEEINALGQITWTQRDEEGRPLEVSDALGTILRARYDQRGNPIEMIAARGDIASTRYNDQGLPIERMRPDGERIAYEYNAHFDLTKLTLPGGRTWTYEYDYLGRMLACTDPTGARTTYAWNDRWQPLASHAPNGDVYTYRYDRAGNCVEMWNAEQVSTRRLNGHGQTIEIQQANGHKTQFRYDREGFLAQVINENGEVMRLEQDVNGLITDVQHFDGRRVHYKYDARGNLLEYTNGLREKTSFTYDPLGQLLEVEYPDGSAAQFEYDERGRLVAARNDVTEQRYRLDEGGLLVDESQSTAGLRFSLAWTYDAMRSATGMRTSLGFETRSTRRPTGQIEALRLDPQTTIDVAYDATGRERARLFSGGAQVETDWDEIVPTQRRLRKSRGLTDGPGAPAWVGGGLGGPDVVLAKTFGYGPTKRVMSRWDQARDSAGRATAQRTDYAYDARGRLLQRSIDGNPIERFSHDPASNLRSDAHPCVYGAGNRLLRWGDTAYTWDDDGRLVEKIRTMPDASLQRFRYEWSGAGFLKRVTLDEKTRVDFTYDPFGRRMSKTRSQLESDGRWAAQSRTFYVWDRRRLVHEVRESADAAGDPIVEERTYAYDDLDPIGHRDTVTRGDQARHGSWTFYAGDVLGTPEHLFSGDGTVLGALARSAYGLTRPLPQSQDTTPLRFEGQYEDAETGLHYNGYRYYDPAIGRYISPDPAGGPPDLNAYRYCQNPIECVDPFGLHNASAEFSNPKGNPPIPPTSLGALDSGGDRRMYEDPHTTNAPTYRSERDAKRNPARTAFNMERFSDTEARAIRDCEGRFTQAQLRGGTLKIVGELPPCRSCRGRMEDFAARNNCNVEYHYPIGSPGGVFKSSGHGNGQTATSSWDHPPEIPLNAGARPAGGYNREDGLRQGYANWRPPRPDATAAP